MKPEGGYRNFVKKRRNTIEFGLIWFISMSTSSFDIIQALMMESQGGNRKWNDSIPSSFDSFDSS